MGSKLRVNTQISTPEILPNYYYIPLHEHKTKETNRGSWNTGGKSQAAGKGGRRTGWQVSHKCWQTLLPSSQPTGLACGNFLPPRESCSCPNITPPAREMLSLHFEATAADDKTHAVEHKRSTSHRWSAWDSACCLPCHRKAMELWQMAEGIGINWDSGGTRRLQSLHIWGSWEQDETCLSGIVRQRCSGWGGRPPKSAQPEWLSLTWDDKIFLRTTKAAELWHPGVRCTHVPPKTFSPMQRSKTWWCGGFCQLSWAQLLAESSSSRNRGKCPRRKLQAQAGRKKPHDCSHTPAMTEHRCTCLATQFNVSDPGFPSLVLGQWRGWLFPFGKRWQCARWSQSHVKAMREGLPARAGVVIDLLRDLGQVT